MKKITLFFLTLSFALFSWQSNAQLTEDFEAGMTNLANATGNTVDFIIETTIIHGGAQSVKNVYTTNNNSVLEQTVAMDLSATNNPILDFWQIAKTEGGWDKCFVEISTDGGTTYVVLPAASYLGGAVDYATNAYFHEDSYADWGTTAVPAENTWWKKESFDLSAYRVANVKIRFKITSDSSVSRDGWYIDDVTVTDPTCMTPNAQTVANITNAAAELGWTDNAGAALWDIEVVAGGTAASGTPTDTGVSNPFTKTGLMANTAYDFYVRADCGGGSVSDWAGPFAFSTLCNVFVAPYTEDFEDGGAIDNCWSMTGGEDWLFSNTGGISHLGNSGTLSGTTTSGGYFAWVDDSTPSSNDVTLTSPFIDVSGLTTPSLYFYLISNNEGQASSTLNVEVFDGAAWVAVGTYTGNTMNGWEQKIVNLSGLTITGNIQVRFIVVESASFYDDIAIDDVAIKEAPTCLVPDSLVVSNETTTTVDLAWTDNAGTANYEYVAQTVGGGVPTTAGTAINTNPATISGLMASTVYDMYLRADCGGGDFSDWVLVSATTICGAYGDFTENFDTTAVNTLPLCWSSVVTSTSAAARVEVRNNLANSEPNSMELYNGNDTSANLLLITPQLTDLPNDTHRIRFMASGGTDYGLLVGTMSDPTDATTFAPMAGVLITAGFNQYIVNFTTSTTNQYVAMKHAAGTINETIKIDDFVWEPIPSVAPICATNVVADNVDATCGNFGMTLTWDAAANADGYKLTVGTTAGGTDVLNMENVGNVLTYQVTTLHNTQYYYTLTPYNAAGDAAGCTEASFTTAADGCYCSSVPTSNDADGVSNVQLLTTDYASLGDVTYEDHTAGTIVDFPQGLTNNVQITFATGYTYATHIWVDLNDDLVFDDATELLYSGESLAPNPTTLDASFLMPAAATLGNHRMRIGTADTGQATANACYSGSYGVTLDFTINVVVATCAPAIVTTTVVPDCANTQYSIDVDVTTVGDATEITDGTTTWAISSTGIINIGPFTDGASVSLSITHTDATCDFSLGTFTNVCPPANDECADADALTVNTDATCTNVIAGTIYGATDSGVSDNGAGTPNDDVWYTFVATETAHKVSMLNVAGTYTDLVHEVLSGDCTTLVSVNISDPNASVVTGLTVGDTYYLRVFGYSATAGRDTTFDVCVTTLPPPPANDDCVDADALTVNTDATCTNVIAGTIAGATDSGVSDNGAGTPNDDVWYTFVATETAHKVSMLNVAGTYTDLVHEVLSGDCTTLASVNISDANTSIVTGLTVGDTYYVRVFGYSATAGRDTTFDVCVTTLPPPPANDDCANAIVLVGENSIPDAASATQTAGTIEQATDSGVATGSCNGTANDDVWYSFVATEANYNITLFDAFDGVVDLFSGVCGTLTHMSCQDFGTNPEIAATGLTVGDTYYVRVYNYSATAATTPTFGIAIWRTENALSVSSNTIEGFSYYPNPVSNELTMTAKENITSVSIFNMMGQEVRNIKPSALETKVDMSNLSTGTYFVRAQVGESVGTFKIIKQ